MDPWEILKQGEAERDERAKKARKKADKKKVVKQRAMKTIEKAKRKAAEEDGDAGPVTMIHLLAEYARERTESAQRLKDVNTAAMKKQEKMENKLNQEREDQFEWFRANFETLQGNGGRMSKFSQLPSPFQTNSKCLLIPLLLP